MFKTNFLCEPCRAIFNGTRFGHDRPGSWCASVHPHLNSLDEFHDGIGKGCSLCIRVARHLDPESPESLVSSFELVHYTTPANLNIRLCWKDANGQKTFLTVEFGFQLLGSGK